MVIFKDIFNIDDVLKYKGKSAYINKDDLKLDNNMYLDTDLMGIKVYDDDKYIGIVTDIMEMPKNDILVVMSDTKKKFLIPYIEPFIKNIDIKNNKIIIESIEGMIE
jgi:16S rRNA processing protein RimM